MLKYLTCLLIYLSACGLLHSCSGRYNNTSPDIYNFDFETIANGAPKGWQTSESPDSYIYAIDSTTVKNGKYAVAIECSTDNSDFGAWYVTIPHTFEGEQITLSGYIKTQNVTGGFVGLWMRLDPGIAFYNMGDLDIKGTQDWKRYEITFALTPDKLQRILVGGLLSGRGKVWFDNLRVQIDGKDIGALTPLESKIAPAATDTEFNDTSGVTISTLQSIPAKELANLGLIWGYVKYYHPAIQQGLHNWDAELFRLLHKYCDAKSPTEREALIVELIDSLGT